jgi:hypothetical protein
MLNYIKAIGYFSLAALIVTLLIFAPWLNIWAVNTLFPNLQIPYTFETWCAAAILSAVFCGGLFTTRLKS